MLRKFRGGRNDSYEKNSRKLWREGLVPFALSLGGWGIVFHMAEDANTF